jgi:hypothetical protein
MPNLVSASTLATWARQDIAVVAADPFAALVLTTASNIVTDEAEQPNWEIQSPVVAIPRKALRICMFLAGRTYLNPDGTIATAVGPLNERVPEAMAMAAANMTLLEEEKRDLWTLRPDGSTGLWIQPTTRLDDSETTAVFLPDNSGSDWWLPYGDSSTTAAFTPLVP